MTNFSGLILGFTLRSVWLDQRHVVLKVVLSVSGQKDPTVRLMLESSAQNLMEEETEEDSMLLAGRLTLFGKLPFTYFTIGTRAPSDKVYVMTDFKEVRSFKVCAASKQPTIFDS